MKRRALALLTLPPLALLLAAQAPPPDATPAQAGQVLPAQAPAAPSTTPPAALPAPPPPAPAEQVLIYHGEAASILGRTVRDAEDNGVGRVVDVLVDDGGQPRAAVIEVGGFMGLGSRRVAVTWRALRFLPSAGTVGRIRLDLTLDQIKDIPEFKRSTGPSDPPTAVAVPPPPKP